MQYQRGDHVKRQVQFSFWVGYLMGGLTVAVILAIASVR